MTDAAADDTLPARIKASVERWLSEDGWRVESMIEVQGANWALLATDPGQRKVIFIQKPDRDDELVMLARFVFSDEDTAAIYKLSQKERDALLMDMRLDLLRGDVDYDGLDFPLKEVQIVHRIFFDALTKDEFFRRLSQIRRSTVLTQMHLNRVHTPDGLREVANG